MNLVALLLEYKTDGLPGKSGPGDCLRLAHALRHPALANSPLTLLSTVSRCKIGSLIKYDNFLYLEPTETEQMGRVQEKHLANILSESIGDQHANTSPIIHAFIGKENGKPIFTPKLFTSERGHTYARMRVDSSRQNSFMFHDRWKAYRPSEKTSWISVFIRKMETDPQLNTPNWFFSSARKSTTALGYSILWCGSVDGIKCQQGERVISTNGSFEEQMTIISKNTHGAIGWNSGGLDLAAASGVPILRIGEYQRSKGWGCRYNSYLACTTTVGLEPDPNTDQVAQSVVEYSMDAFLSNLDLLSEARHVLLPHGDFLSLDRFRLKKQLIENEIPWPIPTDNPNNLLILTH